MDHHENEQKQTERHHYLFHIFRMEKEENPAYIDLHNLDKVITKPVWGVLNNTSTNNAVVDDVDKDNTAIDNIVSE